MVQVVLLPEAGTVVAVQGVHTLFSQNLPSPCCVPRPVLDTSDTAVYLMGLTILSIAHDCWGQLTRVV